MRPQDEAETTKPTEPIPVYIQVPGVLFPHYSSSIGSVVKLPAPWKGAEKFIWDVCKLVKPSPVRLYLPQPPGGHLSYPSTYIEERWWQIIHYLGTGVPVVGWIYTQNPDTQKVIITDWDSGDWDHQTTLITKQDHRLGREDDFSKLLTELRRMFK